MKDSILSRFKSADSLDSLEGLARLDTLPPEGTPKSSRYGRLAHAVYPGLLAAVTIAVAASWLSQHYGAPVMLFALLIGIAFHFLHQEGRCVAGIEFASRQILRFGVAMLGVRITVEQVAGLGIVPVATVLVAVATTILLGLLVAKWLGLSRFFGLLSGGAVSICGASAALAIAAVLPERQDSQRDTVLAVVTVTGLSTLAMILYPIFVGAIGLDHLQAGIFLGGTIHDVAQVVGAGYMISPQTGDIATYVKLLRVAMLAPVIMAVALALSHGRDTGQRRITSILPLFLVGFVALVAVNSAGLLPKAVIDGATNTSRWCLVIAIAALGMKTSLGDLVKVGWRPVALMIVETVWIAAIFLVSVWYLG